MSHFCGVPFGVFNFCGDSEVVGSMLSNLFDTFCEIVHCQDDFILSEQREHSLLDLK